MIRCTTVLSTILLAVVLSKATIDNERKLFWNTIRRWNVEIADRTDRKERFENLKRAKQAVDRSTSGVILKSLNRYTVNNKAEQAETLDRWAKQSNATFAELHRMALEDQERIKEISHHEYHVENPRDAKRLRGLLEGVKETSERDEEGEVVPLPAENHYWEELGFKPAMNQYGCGSCWAFAAIPAIESLQRALTGYRKVISEQAVVDCIWGGIDGIHGCTGGNPKDLFAWAKEKQFLVSAESYPYTGRFDKPCDESKYEDPKNNGMSKIWLQDWFPTSKTMDGFLGGLLKSPVAFGTYISSDFGQYSGGNWEDKQCAIRRYAHAMLLVGYTETTLRVRNTLGPDWGENGYANLVRFDGSGNQAGYLSSCKYFEHGYYITATPRRDMEYKFCNGNKLGTRAECKKSCEDDGWDLAVIPSIYHLNEAKEIVNRRYPKVAVQNQFNLVWIGLSKHLGEDGHLHYHWGDGCTPDKFMGEVTGKGKYGLLNKNTGVFTMKNNVAYEARGLCSQAINCWDISKAVAHGYVRFKEPGRNNEIERSEGTKATVICRRSYTRIGPKRFKCKNGAWNVIKSNQINTPLPKCEKRESFKQKNKQTGA